MTKASLPFGAAAKPSLLCQAGYAPLQTLGLGFCDPCWCTRILVHLLCHFGWPQLLPEQQMSHLNARQAGKIATFLILLLLDRIDMCFSLSFLLFFPGEANPVLAVLLDGTHAMHISN